MWTIGCESWLQHFADMKKGLLTIICFASLGFVLWKMAGGSRLFLTPPEILGGTVRITNAESDRLYYLTSQWEKRLSRIGGSRSSSSMKTTSWLNVDLWTIDPATAQPVSRKRLKRDKVNGDLSAMGVEQGVLWARIPELVGIRLSDGVIVADSGKIEARNKGLAGLMPKPPGVGIFMPQSMQPLKFDPKSGLVVMLADARRMRIDPVTLEATPLVSPAKNNPKPDAGVAVNQVSNGMNWQAMVRGFSMERADGELDWIGLMAESELESAKERRTIGNRMDFSVPNRQKLYRARLKPTDDFLGKSWRFHDPVVLPETPEFLMGGLLAQGVGNSNEETALWRRNPDSVFVLSRDRLGDDGRLQLARVGGPAGKPVWSIALPLTNMSSWIPAERHVMMLGPNPSAKRSPMVEENENPVMHVISIDLETGALRSFNPDFYRDWPVDGGTSKKP